MRSLGRGLNRSGPGPELAPENVGRGISLAEVVLEIFRTHDAVLIHDVGAWMRHAVGERVEWNALVEDAEGADHLRLRVGEHRVGDSGARGEMFEHGRAVV